MTCHVISPFRYPKSIPMDYIYYHPDEIEKRFPTIISSLKLKELKSLCLRLALLYETGGYSLDIDIFPIQPITNPIGPTFVSSLFLPNTLFLGIIGAPKRCQLILGLIVELTTLETMPTPSINHYLYNRLINNPQITLLTEKHNTQYTIDTIDNNQNTLFQHQLQHQPPNYTPTTNKQTKIGITLTLFPTIHSFFNNGINQNALYLAELLLNCNYDVHFIVETQKLNQYNITQLSYDKRFQFTPYHNILYEHFDIIFTLSFSINEPFLHKYFQHEHTKHIGYFCGNSYLIDSEQILYNQHSGKQQEKFNFTNNYDAIWCIPQMSDMNLDYWKIIHNCPCIEVPFVWSSNAIEISILSTGLSYNELLYVNRNRPAKIAIFEPNISIMKWCMLPMLITEEVNKKSPEKIDHLFITNIQSSSTNDFNLPKFQQFTSNLTIKKQEKCSIESRYNTLWFMSKHADIAISHQWGNPLNYLYFDLAWMGWPILHNADKCKNVGYYYPNFQLIEASQLLTHIIDNHQNNINYLEQNRSAIQPFLASNVELQQQYKKLINDILQK